MRTRERHPKRLIRGVIIAAMLAISSIFLTAAPAQAGEGEMTICFWTVNDEGFWERTCFTIEVPVAGPRKWWPPECWVCAPSWNFGEELVNPAVFHESLGKGLVLLAQSSLEKDEKLAVQLREEALTQAFLAAAEVTKGSEAPFKEFAWIDPKSGKTYSEPQPHPWLTGIGADLESGIRLMQQAALDPSRSP